VLRLPHTQVDDEGVRVIAQLPAIQDLDLENTTVTGVTFGSMTKLEALNLERTKLTDNGLDIVAQLPSLKKLSIAYTSISDAGLKSLHAARGLKELNLTGTGGLSNDEIQLVRKALPDCDIRR
jgi:hypothetical protein